MNDTAVIGLTARQEYDIIHYLDVSGFNVRHDKPKIEYRTFDPNIKNSKSDFREARLSIRYIDLVQMDKRQNRHQNTPYRFLDTSRYLEDRKTVFLKPGDYYNAYSNARKEHHMDVRYNKRQPMYSTLAVPAVGVLGGVLTGSPLIGVTGGFITAGVLEWMRYKDISQIDMDMEQLKPIYEAMNNAMDNIERAEVHVTYRQDIADFVKEARSGSPKTVDEWKNIERQIANMYGYDKFLEMVRHPREWKGKW